MYIIKIVDWVIKYSTRFHVDNARCLKKTQLFTILRTILKNLLKVFRILGETIIYVRSKNEVDHCLVWLHYQRWRESLGSGLKPGPAR